MLGKIADLLLSLSLKWAARASYKDQLKPIAVFLQHQMEVLRENLYLTSLKAVVMDIWQRLIKVSGSRSSTRGDFFHQSKRV